MRCLILSFYYPPDLSAGSFRTAALITELAPLLPSHAEVDVLTTCPNRYRSFGHKVDLVEAVGPITIRRIPVPPHRSGLADQSTTFLAYARGVLSHVRHRHYDLVYATSSRLMTAFLGARVSRGGNIPLYLDIRDMFVDTVQDVFRGRHTRALVPALSWMERYAVASARRVNLVSPGFAEYFRSRHPRARLDFFTNGIDDDFLGIDWAPRTQRSSRIRVLYAGNIGQGQGLHAILPELAAATSLTHEYVVVGDGGARRQLELALVRTGGRGVVRLCPPVGRDKLVELYREADVLMLHLNDMRAFEKVLPSKIFEYAATGKPMLAGVAGYAKSFVQSEVLNARVFSPCDVRGAIGALKSLDPELTDRSLFVEKYRRSKIMRELAAAVLETGGVAGGGRAEEDADGC